MSEQDSRGVNNEGGNPAASMQNESEIDLLALLLVIARNKAFILKVTFGAAILAAVLSLRVDNVYRAEMLLAPAQQEDSKKGGLSAMLGGLGGMASLAGISLGGGNSDEYLAVLQSREFLWQFAQEKKLLPILFENEWDKDKKAWKESDPEDQPNQMDLFRLMVDGGVLSVDKDKKTQLVTLSVQWKDPELAAEWANSLVDKLNRHLAQREIERSQSSLKYLNEELMKTPIEEMRSTLFDLIAGEQKKAMLANTQKDFAFKVLDKAVAPDKKVKPRRSLIVIAVALVAFLVAVFWVFIRGMFAKSRLDPDRSELLRELRMALRWRNQDR